MVFFSKFLLLFLLSLIHALSHNNETAQKATKGLTPIWSIFFPPFFLFPMPFPIATKWLLPQNLAKGSTPNWSICVGGDAHGCSVTCHSTKKKSEN